MDARLREIKTARKIDELEELKNRLIKTQHRLHECDKLYEQYKELVKHWRERDVRYKKLQKQYQDLNNLYKGLQKDAIEMEEKLRKEIKELTPKKSYVELDRRYQLLKTSYEQCQRRRGYPLQRRTPSSPPRPRGTPARGVHRPLPRRSAYRGPLVGTSERGPLVATSGRRSPPYGHPLTRSRFPRRPRKLKLAQRDIFKQ